MWLVVLSLSIGSPRDNSALINISFLTWFDYIGAASETETDIGGANPMLRSRQIAYTSKSCCAVNHSRPSIEVTPLHNTPSTRVV